MKNLESMALRFRDGQLFILDQTLLPQEEKWHEAMAQHKIR